MHSAWEHLVNAIYVIQEKPKVKEMTITSVHFDTSYSAYAVFEWSENGVRYSKRKYFLNSKYNRKTKKFEGTTLLFHTEASNNHFLKSPVHPLVTICYIDLIFTSGTIDWSPKVLDGGSQWVFLIRWKNMSEIILSVGEVYDRNGKHLLGEKKSWLGGLEKCSIQLCRMQKHRKANNSSA
tara:strand:- start:456 stop:995 length:540 start_codon:yes stop_codon:yes gene_type:complete